MKLFLPFIFLISLNSIAQKEKVSLKLSKKHHVYLGHEAVLYLNSKKGDVENLTLKCIECDTIYLDDTLSNSWIITTDSTKRVDISVLDENQNIIRKAKFKVLPVPIPTVYLDRCSEKEIVTEFPMDDYHYRMFLLLDRKYKVNCVLGINDWYVKIDDKVFSGNGSSLSRGVRYYMNMIKKGVILLNINYSDELGVNSLKRRIRFKLK